MKPSEKATLLVRQVRKLNVMRDDLEDMRDTASPANEICYSMVVEAVRSLEVRLRADAMHALHYIGRQPPLF